MTRMMTGGEAMIRAAAANGIDTAFGLPGAQIYALFDGIRAVGLELVVPRHEQTAGYMAMGYARSTGRPALCCVVPGPGVLNAAAALCTAMGNGSPVVCLTGQVPSAYLGKGRGHLHELRDQLATLGSILKRAVRIEDPHTTSRVVNEAIGAARSGRPGPVSVEMCWDTMAASAPLEIEPAAPPIERPQPDLDAIDVAARTLARARKPMIFCGSGAQHAAEEVRALAQALTAPVTAFRGGRGVLPEDDPLGVASVAARELWDDVDVALGIGSRLEMPFMRWRDGMRYEPRPSGAPTLIRIDIDPAEMSRLVPDVAVVGDSADACRLLTDRLGAARRPDRHRLAEIDAAKRLAGSLIERLQPEAAYLEVIRRALPRDGFLVPELSQVGFASYTGAFPVLAPRTYVTEGHQGTLGFGFPTALGVKVAHPGRAVVSVTGDGGFMFAAQELATAAQYSIGVVTLVFNNRSFGNVLRDQQQQFDGRIVGAELSNPDFVAFARSFGVDAERVSTPQALEPVLEAALGRDRPALIEVELAPGSEASPWPLIHMSRRPSELAL